MREGDLGNGEDLVKIESVATWIRIWLPPTWKLVINQRQESSDIDICLIRRFSALEMFQKDARVFLNDFVSEISSAADRSVKPKRPIYRRRIQPR